MRHALRLAGDRRDGLATCHQHGAPALSGRATAEPRAADLPGAMPALPPAEPPAVCDLGGATSWWPDRHWRPYKFPHGARLLPLSNRTCDMRPLDDASWLPVTHLR